MQMRLQWVERQNQELQMQLQQQIHFGRSKVDEVGQLANLLTNYRNMTDRAADLLQASSSSSTAVPATQPPTFPHIHPDVIFDHLIFHALPTEGEVASRPQIADSMQSHLGISLSTTDLSFKPAVPGAVQTQALVVKNTQEYPVLLKSVRFEGHVVGPSPFSITSPLVPSGGMLIPAKDELEFTVQCEAPDERGLSRQWLFLLFEATEADARTVRIASFVLGATLAMYTFHEESLVALSAEAPPFFPAELLALWSTRPDMAFQPPAKNFPAFHRPDGELTDGRGQLAQLQRLEAEGGTTAFEARVAALKAGYEPRASQPLREWLRHGTLQHWGLLQMLLLLEEYQQSRDYQRMDVFHTVAKGKRSRSTPYSTFTVEVPGLMDQHPPVQQGDTLSLRFVHLPNFQLGLRVINVERRTVLVLQPKPADEELQTAAAQALQMARSRSLNVDERGYNDICSLTTGGKAPCHLRFELDRSMMVHMHFVLTQLHGLSKWLAAMGATPGYLAPLVLACAPIEADLHERPPDMGADVLPATAERISPLQPQINREQIQAVRDVLVHEHGSLPYLVFGPPGTGKTMVLIETVVQALVHVREPRILVSAPSNAAADVIMKRLHEVLPEVQRRRAEHHGEGRVRLLRLNSQQRALSSVPAETFSYCHQDPEVAMFSVPPLSALRQFHVVVATCGATRLLVEAGVPYLHVTKAMEEVCLAVQEAVLSSAATRSGEAAGGSTPEGRDDSLAVDALTEFAQSGHFTHVIIDEASQGLEAELMLPLAFAFPGTSVALCGDHKQLGPVVRSPFCRSHGLAESMLERLMKLPLYAEGNGGGAAGEPSGHGEGAADDAPPTPRPRPRCTTKLVRNYRSHGALLELPSRVSYGGALLECADRSVTCSMGEWSELVSRGFPLLFYGCTSAHSLAKVDPSSAHPSNSYMNATEAEKVVDLIMSLLGRDPRANAPAEEGVETHAVNTNDIGVVTPFRAQVVHLRQRLRKLGLGAIRVGTVDDYQGQEELIIVISTVIGSTNARSIAAMSHGLMSSPQRFNVAITRAKALLVIVGDPNALWEDRSWRELLQYSVDHSAYRGCPQPYAPHGVDDEAKDLLQQLLPERVQRSLLGVGAASIMFPGFGAAMWEGDGGDLDDDQGWKVY